MVACTKAKTLLCFHLYLPLLIRLGENSHSHLKIPLQCPLAIIYSLQSPITLSHRDSRWEKTLARNAGHEAAYFYTVFYGIPHQLWWWPLEKEAARSAVQPRGRGPAKTHRSTGHIKALGGRLPAPPCSATLTDNSRYPAVLHEYGWHAFVLSCLVVYTTLSRGPAPAQRPYHELCARGSVWLPPACPLKALPQGEGAFQNARMCAFQHPTSPGLTWLYSPTFSIISRWKHSVSTRARINAFSLFAMI